MDAVVDRKSCSPSEAGQPEDPASMVCRGQRHCRCAWGYPTGALDDRRREARVTMATLFVCWLMENLLPRPQRRDDLQDALLGKIDELGPLVRFFSHQSQCAITADDFQKSFAGETRLALAVA
jgi:hypothetical protein